MTIVKIKKRKTFRGIYASRFLSHYPEEIIRWWFIGKYEISGVTNIPIEKRKKIKTYSTLY
jgi:hypothetical protein